MKKSINGKKLIQTDIAIPCGTAAWSYFNDTFSLYDQNNINIPISDKGIAWSDDIKYKFKN